jgi:enoyl-CoA hydratase/carnithine racemase
MPKNVTLDVSDGVGLVTLTRPPVNALNRELRLDLIAAIDEMSDRRDVRCVVLTGAGKVFCAGADMKQRPDLDTPGDWPSSNRAMREVLNVLKECPQPVIAAVNGPALGAGFGIAASCDIILAADDVFGMPEINVGVAGGAALLHELFGRSEMRRLLFTGATISAKELERRSVISAAVPREQLMDRALEWAAEIASKHPVGIGYAKRSANLVALMSPRDGYRFEQDYTVALARLRQMDTTSDPLFGVDPPP